VEDGEALPAPCAFDTRLAISKMCLALLDRVADFVRNLRGGQQKWKESDDRNNWLLDMRCLKHVMNWRTNKTPRHKIRSALSPGPFLDGTSEETWRSAKLAQQGLPHGTSVHNG
jgi:hypothetical protein